MDQAEKIKKVLMDEGAGVVGVTSADDLPEVERQIVEEGSVGMFGEMRWLERSAHKRVCPQDHLSGAKSIVCSAWPYLPHQKNKYFARYSLHKDYHEYILEKLKNAWHKLKLDKNHAKFFVDSKPIAEKAYAFRSGIGWIGKNSLIINKDIGSFFCLGLILTDAEIGQDQSNNTNCGECTKCIDACPTKAIVEPGVVDCNRCIAYLTTEHKGEIPKDLQCQMGTSVFGCDICQEVCPYNQKVAAGSSLPEKSIQTEKLNDLLTINDKTFEEMFADTPIVRLGKKRFIRNVTIAINNENKVLIDK